MTYKQLYKLWLRSIMALIVFAIMMYTGMFISLVWAFRTSYMAFVIILIMGAFIMYCDNKMLKIKRWLSNKVTTAILEKFCTESNYLCLHDIVLDNSTETEKKYAWIDHIIITKKAIVVIETKFNNAIEIIGKVNEPNWTYVTKKIGRKKEKFKGHNAVMLNEENIKAIKRVLVDYADLNYLNYVSYIDWVDFKNADVFSDASKFVRTYDIPQILERDMSYVTTERMDTMKMSRICVKLHEAEIKNEEIRNKCINVFENMHAQRKVYFDNARERVIADKKENE